MLKLNLQFFASKKGYKKKQGHRQPYTKVVIEAINA